MPSCTDNIQNQLETGIDCGGPCEPCLSSIDQEELIKEKAEESAKDMPKRPSNFWTLIKLAMKLLKYSLF